MFENFLDVMFSILIIFGFFLIVWAGITQKKAADILSELLEKIKELQPAEEIEERSLI